MFPLGCSAPCWWMRSNIHASVSSGCTFQTADPPQARVGQRSRVFLVLVVGLVLAGVGRAVADKGPSVQPVVCANGHRHQGKGCKRSHGGQQHLDAALTPHQSRSRKETDVWEEDRHANSWSDHVTCAVSVGWLQWWLDANKITSYQLKTCKLARVCWFHRCTSVSVDIGIRNLELDNIGIKKSMLECRNTN